MGSKKFKVQPDYEGHGDSTKPPSLAKGEFESPATFLDQGAFTSTEPRGISPNVKSGQPSGESVS